MKVSYDQHQIRYTQTREGSINYPSLVFLPGGPGADSSYFYPFIKTLRFPGSIWCVDFPGNGSNHSENFKDFDRWFDLLIPMIERFKKPILVGHSFGAMIALLSRELENKLSGFVALASSPVLCDHDMRQYMDDYGLPDIEEEYQAFQNNPGEMLFRQVLRKQGPYHFTEKALEEGMKLLDVPFNFRGPLWWGKRSELSTIKPNGFRWLFLLLFLGEIEMPLRPFPSFKKTLGFRGLILFWKKLRMLRTGLG